MFRRLLQALMCGLLALTLAGCSPATIGRIAIARDSDATVSAVVILCDGRLDSIALRPAAMTTVLGGSAVPSPGERMTWEFDHLAVERAEIDLDGVNAYMVSGKFSLEAHGEVGLWDQGVIAGPSGFTPEDVASVGADQVLASVPDSWGFQIIDRAWFERSACD
ncbi:hypothetical protein QL996_02415 [Planococcus sp. APC 4015]|nr:hypothetical protein [Planococcus sp. APC 4015]